MHIAVQRPFVRNILLLLVLKAYLEVTQARCRRCGFVI